MVDTVFVSLRPRLVLIRLVVFVLLLVAEFGPLVCCLARMSLTIMSTFLSSATLWTVFRALDTVFLDPQKRTRLCVGPFSCSAAGVSASASVLGARSTCRALPASVVPCMSQDDSPMHDSRFAGGLLPVCKSTSYNLEVGRQGPTWRKDSKGGVSGPVEDLRPVPEVEAGVNFRPAGSVRRQVAGSIPRRQPGTGTRRVREGAVTPFLHPEVSGIQFVSPGYGLDIRQSMGWTKVCQITQSGIWVLKGNSRTCMFPANLDHLRVEWIQQGTYETAWVTPVHGCLCSYKYGHGAAVRPQTNNSIWNGVIGLRGRIAPFLSPWCGKKDVPTGVNLNQYAGPGSLIRWHSDKRALVRPTEFS